MAQYYPIWFSILQHVSVFSSMAQYSLIWLSILQHGSVHVLLHGSAWCSVFSYMVQHGSSMAQYSPTRLSILQHSSVFSNVHSLECLPYVHTSNFLYNYMIYCIQIIVVIYIKNSFSIGLLRTLRKCFLAWYSRCLQSALGRYCIIFTLRYEVLSQSAAILGVIRNGMVILCVSETSVPEVKHYTHKRSVTFK